MLLFFGLWDTGLRTKIVPVIMCAIGRCVWVSRATQAVNGPAWEGSQGRRPEEGKLWSTTLTQGVCNEIYQTWFRLILIADKFQMFWKNGFCLLAMYAGEQIAHGKERIFLLSLRPTRLLLIYYNFPTSVEFHNLTAILDNISPIVWQFCRNAERCCEKYYL